MKEHLKGLDTLRAIAALVVVIGHIELLKKNNQIANLIDSNSPILPNGHIAVILFFVLSGFLITFLLIKELDLTSKISFKNFYLRRILRIWPLYYFIILLSFLLIESQHSFITYILCLTIFPNVAHAIGEGWSSSPQIWSIGVEEQFYLIWPLLLFLIFKVKKNWLPALLLSFFIGYSLLPHVIGFINVRTFNSPHMITIERFFFGTKYNCMAIGAFIGIAYANRKKWVSLMNKNLIFIPIAIGTFSLWFFKFELSHFTGEFYALLFALLILGTIGSNTINIDNKLTRFLGKISYGLYMYHWIIALLLIKYLPAPESDIAYNILLYTSILGTTILVSWLSFTFFEKKFLNLKPKFRGKQNSENE